ncbi:carboxypeptidase-like regulatory domain-containing protein [Dethiothermospora halolimnae]|uniref:carboxypeptidase-like regulatory domain-containing protein n=1 Tax=Dethiothermospora halolimnae TaxID=3114390 RepID=UPI003CCB8C8D
MNNECVKVYGNITDFNGTPLSKAEVRLTNDKFENIYKTYTDDDGKYELNVEKGVYYAFYACKDYKVNYLEYWAWNVPLFDNMEINAQIDGLEIYSLTAFPVKWSFPQLMVYFRPMSLKKAKELEESGICNFKKKSVADSVELIDICPELTKNDIEVFINNKKVEVFQINRVKEYGGENKYIYSYLIHVGLNNGTDRYEYNKVDIRLTDRETEEKGEGSVFWKEERSRG